MKKIFTYLLALGVAFIFANHVQAQCSGQTQVTVTIVVDNYGSETTWSITGQGGSPTYLSGGPYTDGTNGTSHTDQVCIPYGTNVTFKINDAYGDGICCAYGNGSYTVTQNGCDVVASGGEFGSSETQSFTTVQQASVDLAVNSIDLDPVIIQGSTPISGELQNLGTSAITSFDLNYSIDNGTAVTQNITGVNIASCSTYTYNHSTPWNANSTGNFSVKVWVSNVNSGTDGNSANDDMTTDVAVATQSVPRTNLLEDFSSATCAPCASLNAQLDPLLRNTLHANVTGQSNLAVIKYQMNWPSPGNDPSYNQDGNTRRGFYGVNGIPSGFLDGKDPGGSALLSAGTYASAAAVPAFMDLDLGFTVNGMMVDVTAVVTPHADFTGPIKLFIALTEDYYSYTGGTTSQTDFPFVQRKMLPNGNGNLLTNITADTSITVNKSYTFTGTSPAQNNSDLWGSIDDITVVAFVQNTTTHEVYQVAFLSEPGNVGINQVEKKLDFKVFPNPFKEETNVFYTLEDNQPVTAKLYNTLGELVYSNDLGTQSAGQHNLTIDAANLNSGIYFLNMMVGNDLVMKRISVAK